MEEPVQRLHPVGVVETYTGAERDYAYDRESPFSRLDKARAGALPAGEG